MAYKLDLPNKCCMWYDSWFYIMWPCYRCKYYRHCIYKHSQTLDLNNC